MAIQTIYPSDKGNNFIDKINANFSECATGGSTDGSVVIKTPLQGGDLKSSTGQVDGRWCGDLGLSIGSSTLNKTWVYTDDNYYKYLHTPCFLSLKNNKVKSVNKPSGSSLSIFCYNDAMSLISGGVVSDVSNIPYAAAYVKFQLYNASGYSQVLALEMTLAAEPAWVKNAASPLTPQFFNYDVHPEKLWDNSSYTTRHQMPTDASVDADNTRYHDNGFVILPPTYSPTGKPTKFVLFLQGDGLYACIGHNPYVGIYQNKITASIYEANYKYLCNCGYAVAVCGGYTSMWKDEAGATKPGSWTPKITTAYLSSIFSFYERLMLNYNFQPEAYLMAKSAGGYTMVYLASLTPFPIKAAAGFSIGISMASSMSRISQAVQKSWQKRVGALNWDSFALNQTIGGTGNNIDAVRADITAGTSTNAFKDAQRLVDNIDLYKSLDPFTVGSDINFTNYMNGILNFDAFNGTPPQALSTAIASAHKAMRAPTKLWCSTNDPNVPYQWHQLLSDWVKRDGGICELRTYVPADSIDGGHNTFCGGAFAGGKVANVDTPFGGAMSDVNIGIIEAVEWFKRW